MEQFKPMALLTVVYLLVGGLLYVVEHHVATDFNSILVVSQLLGIAIGFWLFTAIEFLLTSNNRKVRPNSMIGMYVALKGARFLLAAIVLFVYGLLGGGAFLLFGINLIVFFLFTMAFTTAYYLKVEQKISNKA
jgi:hypothetical protein